MNKLRVLARLALLVTLAIGLVPMGGSQVMASPPLNPTGANLLANGDFDQSSFYWRPTNHFVGGMWYEWWVGGEMPEFIDGGHPHHSQCYPVPTTGSCESNYNHSQGYIRWGVPFVAGVYQPVPVVACTTYRFTAYNRNDDWYYHPKVGIDPTGWRPTELHGAPPDNCPPDSQTPCPNPSLDQNHPFPSTMIWSPEFEHTPLTWASQSITAEATAMTVTVWTYVAPDSNSGFSRSAYWDYTSLVQVPPANGKLIAEGTLPAADGSITNVTTQTTALRATLGWKTGQPALTQVLYHYVGDANMPSPPPIANVVSAYEFSTAIGYTPSTDHQARLPSLRPTSLYDYVILARKLVGNSCQTSVYTGRLSTTDMLVPQGALPAPSSDITGLTILPFEHSAYVIWQSAKPSYSQVLYHYAGPITPTILPTLTQQVFLPIAAVASTQDSTLNYEFRTVPITTFTTLHIIQLTGLQTDSVYSAVAVSAWTEGDADEVAVSSRADFRTAYTPTQASVPSRTQLAEQLQACLSGGKALDACVEKAK